MLFHEMYGTYFHTVARILTEAGRTPVSGKRILDIVSENAFSESMLVIPEKLESGAWPLLAARETRERDGAGGKHYASVLSHVPSRPLSALEKQWLKALLADPRIRLFLYREEDREAFDRLSSLLADVPALFGQEMFDYYDRYQDGDDYTDEAYVACFHAVLRAIREKRLVCLRYTGSRGGSAEKEFVPYGMEYSSKDDKFRVLCMSLHGRPCTINVSRIRECRIGRLAEREELHLPEIRLRHVDLELTDERNALQRAMLHFSDLRKETEKIDEMHYRIRLFYRRDDETEIVIRILAFGPMIRVTAPEQFIGLIRDRIIKQERLCGL